MKTVEELNTVRPLRPIQTRLPNGMLLLACRAPGGEWWSSWTLGIVKIEDLVEYSSKGQVEGWLGWEQLVALPVNGIGVPDFDAITARLQAATSGAWVVIDDHGDTVLAVMSADGEFMKTYNPLATFGEDPEDANAQLVVHAKEDIGALLQHITTTDQLIASWRTDPAVHLDPDGSVRIDMHKVEEREERRSRVQRVRAERAETALREHRSTGDYESGVEHGASVAVDRLVGLIESLADPNPCHFDKSGNCLAHGFELAPHEKCPEQEAKDLISLYRESNSAAAGTFLDGMFGGDDT